MAAIKTTHTVCFILSHTNFLPSQLVLTLDCSFSPFYKENHNAFFYSSIYPRVVSTHHIIRDKKTHSAWPLTSVLLAESLYASLKHTRCVTFWTRQWCRRAHSRLHLQRTGMSRSKINLLVWFLKGWRLVKLGCVVRVSEDQERVRYAPVLSYLSLLRNP
jgi:hypothetical protein